MPWDRKRLLGYVETIQLILGVTDKVWYNTGQDRIWRSSAKFWLSYGPLLTRLRLMQKLYWHFCVINFTFPQSYYIWQLLNIGKDYPVPVDEYDSDLNSTPPPDP